MRRSCNYLLLLKGRQEERGRRGRGKGRWVGVGVREREKEREKQGVGRDHRNSEELRGRELEKRKSRKKQGLLTS